MFMKKWWLEHDLKDEQGRHLQFRGWINTMHETMEEIPETITGTFWARADSKLDLFSDGRQGMNGFFNLGSGEADNYVIGSVYPVYLSEGLNYANNPSRFGADLILKATQPVKNFPRFGANIEDCLVLEKTHIEKVNI